MEEFLQFYYIGEMLSILTFGMYRLAARKLEIDICLTSRRSYLRILILKHVVILNLSTEYSEAGQGTSLPNSELTHLKWSWSYHHQILRL